MKDIVNYCLQIVWLGVTIVGSFIIGFIIMIAILALITDPFEQNWGEKIPTTCEQTYYVDEGASFHGDGTRYHVYTCSSPEEMKRWVEWKMGPNASVELIINDWMKDLEVDEGDELVFDQTYQYFKLIRKKENRAYLIWIESDQKLYIVESFI